MTRSVSTLEWLQPYEVRCSGSSHILKIVEVDTFLLEIDEVVINWISLTNRGMIGFTLWASWFHDSKALWVAALKDESSEMGLWGQILLSLKHHLEDGKYAVCNFAGWVVESQSIILYLVIEKMWPNYSLQQLTGISCRTSIKLIMSNSGWGVIWTTNLKSGFNQVAANVLWPVFLLSNLGRQESW